MGVRGGTLRINLKTSETKVMKVSMVVQKGPSKGRCSFIMVRQETLRINFKNITNKSCDSVDSCVGRTVEGTTVCHKGMSRDT